MTIWHWDSGKNTGKIPGFAVWRPRSDEWAAYLHTWTPSGPGMMRHFPGGAARAVPAPV